MHRFLLINNNSKKKTNFLLFLKNQSEILKEFSPLECLNENGKNSKSVLEQIVLKPKDTYKLYKNMNIAYKDSFDKSLEEYSKFEDKSIIKRNDVREFEQELKQTFLENLLSDPEKVKYKSFLASIREGSFAEKKIFYAENHLPILIEYLKKNDMLPCLMFSLDRYKCEKLTRILLDYFETKEKELRSTVYKAKIEELKLKRSREETHKKKSRDKKDTENEIEEFNDYSLLDNYLDECCLGDKRRSSDEELKEDLKWAFGDLSDWRCQALLRGFCYHHSGLDNKKRVCIEKFLRTKIIQLVFCTTTLAQGIHVPCKSTVFYGDYFHLDSGTFKQCAGRAGRRGYDTHGNVIFLNVPEVKVKQLISSKPANIQGSFLLSPTFILRLYNLAIESSNSVIDSTMAIINNGLSIFNSQPEERTCLIWSQKFYFLFCSEFLYQNSLLNLNGIPRGYFNFTICFGYQEPGNLVLNYLIKQGVFERMCRTEQDETERHKKIIIVLSYLFNNIWIYNHKLKRINEERLRNTYNSRIILADLPEEFAQPLENYNQNIDRIFKKNLKIQSRLFNQELDFILPFSKYNYENEIKNNNFSNGTIEKELTENSSEQSTELISNFSSLSGLTDEDVFIKEKSILMHLKWFFLDLKNLYPTVNDSKSVDFYGKQMKLNSYLLDFFNHGVYQSILDENKIRDDSAYSFLFDFKRILQKLACLEASNSRFVQSVRSLSAKFESIFEKANFDFSGMNFKRLNKDFAAKKIERKEKLKPDLRKEKPDKFLREFGIKEY